MLPKIKSRIVACVAGQKIQGKPVRIAITRANRWQSKMSAKVRNVNLMAEWKWQVCFRCSTEKNVVKNALTKIGARIHAMGAHPRQRWRMANVLEVSAKKGDIPNQRNQLFAEGSRVSALCSPPGGGSRIRCCLCILFQSIQRTAKIKEIKMARGEREWKTGQLRRLCQRTRARSG